MVKISEPVTMITDYIITLVTFVYAILIFTLPEDTNHLGTQLLATSLLITGLGAFFGGTSHGFKDNFKEGTNNLIWKLTTYTIGLAAVLLYCSVVVTSLQYSFFRSIILLFAGIQALFYFTWMRSRTKFVYVIINYGVFMILALILKIFAFFSFNDPSSSWIIAGIVVTFLASGLQASGFTIHPKYFNHNDLFHIIQLPSFYLMYQGALLMELL